MTEELKRAIKLIEDNGGIVMLQELDNDMSDYSAIIDREAQEKADLEKWQAERKQSLAALAEDFDQMLGTPGFSFNGVADLCHYHGCDLDDIEDIIHGYY